MMVVRKFCRARGALLNPLWLMRGQAASERPIGSDKTHTTLNFGTYITGRHRQARALSGYRAVTYRTLCEQLTLRFIEVKTVRIVYNQKRYLISLRKGGGGLHIVRTVQALCFYLASNGMIFRYFDKLRHKFDVLNIKI